MNEPILKKMAAAPINGSANGVSMNRASLVKMETMVSTLPLLQPCPNRSTRARPSSEVVEDMGGK